MSEALADKKCVPCRGGVPPLKGEELKKLHDNIPEWEVVSEHHLHREFRFPDFKQALDFLNRVGAVAEQEGHHPDILLAWGKVGITLWTDTIDGLTESDFILAAKVDRLAGEVRLQAAGLLDWVDHDDFLGFLAPRRQLANHNCGQHEHDSQVSGLGARLRPTTRLPAGLRYRLAGSWR